MMIWTQIAVGLTVLVCFTFLCYYCCRNRQMRTRLTFIRQVSAISESQLLRQKDEIGIQKAVLNTFPTIKASELQIGVQEENRQCSICLLEYEESDLLRLLPICGHIFHIDCVDPWLEKQPTCPVCRIVLSTKASEASSDHENRSFPSPQYYRASSATLSTLTVELATSNTPSWILVNRPLPLPRATQLPSTAISSSSGCNMKASCFTSSGDYSSGTPDLEAGSFRHSSLLEYPGEYPLLKATDSGGHLAGGSGSGNVKCIVSIGGNSKSQDDRQSCTAASTSACNDIQIEKSRSVKNHSVKSSRKFSTESFSFELPDSFIADNAVLENQMEEPGAADQTLISFSNKFQTTTKTNHCTELDSRTWPANMMMPSRIFGSGSSKMEEGLTRCYAGSLKSDSTVQDESRVWDSHLPLTLSPEQCSFQFLPVVTAPCSADFSFKPTTTH